MLGGPFSQHLWLLPHAPLYLGRKVLVHDTWAFSFFFPVIPPSYTPFPYIFLSFSASVKVQQAFSYISSGLGVAEVALDPVSGMPTR